jgi:hypothetical protein
MKRRALALVASLALLALTSGPTLAGTYVVDQSQTNIGTSIGGTSPVFAQTFTAGIYGQLESVDLHMDGRSTVAVSLQGVTGNPPAPDGTILGEKVLGVNNPGDVWVRFNFSTYPIVTPGQMYAIFIYPTGSLSALYGSVADLYPGGQALEFRDGAWAPISVRLPGVLSDWAFATNVDPIPVPTPPGRLVATPVPTHAPAATLAPAAAPTPTATPTPTPTPTPSATLAPTIVPSASPTATAVSTSSAAPVGSGANSGSGGVSGPGSSGSSGSPDLTLPIAGAALAVLLAGAGGFWFLFMRPGTPAG